MAVTQVRRESGNNDDEEENPIISPREVVIVNGCIACGIRELAIRELDGYCRQRTFILRVSTSSCETPHCRHDFCLDMEPLLFRYEARGVCVCFLLIDVY